jgi:hypothetical protein
MFFSQNFEKIKKKITEISRKEAAPDKMIRSRSSHLRLFRSCID